jgi:hypothetical protein
MLSALPDENFLIFKKDFIADQFSNRNYTMPKRLYPVGYTEGIMPEKCVNFVKFVPNNCLSASVCAY